MNKVKLKFKSLVLIFLILICFFCSIFRFEFFKISGKEWKNTLYTPTMIQKVDDTYFIIDCWHHRVIYNDNLEDDISKWETMTDDIKGSHSLASDGEVYLIDDTDNNAIRVFIKNNEKFVETQNIKNIEGRPHCIIYDEKTKLFYAISSEKGEIRVLQNADGVVHTVKDIVIDKLVNSYVRSINIIDGYLYCVSGPGKILKLKYDDLTFDVVKEYAVPDEIMGMNYIEKIGEYFYISSYTNAQGVIAPKFIRIKKLTDLKNSKYEDLYELFGFKGTPYYISAFDDRHFITEIDASSGVKSFKVKNNKISSIKTQYFFKGHSKDSEKRKNSVY